MRGFHHAGMLLAVLGSGVAALTGCSGGASDADVRDVGAVESQATALRTSSSLGCAQDGDCASGMGCVATDSNELAPDGGPGGSCYFPGAVDSTQTTNCAPSKLFSLQTFQFPGTMSDARTACVPTTSPPCAPGSAESSTNRCVSSNLSSVLENVVPFVDGGVASYTSKGMIVAGAGATVGTTIVPHTTNVVDPASWTGPRSTAGILGGLSSVEECYTSGTMSLATEVAPGTSGASCGQPYNVLKDIDNNLTQNTIMPVAGLSFTAGTTSDYYWMIPGAGWSGPQGPSLAFNQNSFVTVQDQSVEQRMLAEEKIDGGASLSLGTVYNGTEQFATISFSNPNVVVTNNVVTVKTGTIAQYTTNALGTSGFITIQAAVRGLFPSTPTAANVTALENSLTSGSLGNVMLLADGRVLAVPPGFYFFGVLGALADSSLAWATSTGQSAGTLNMLTCQSDGFWHFYKAGVGGALIPTAIALDLKAASYYSGAIKAPTGREVVLLAQPSIMPGILSNYGMDTATPSQACTAFNSLNVWVLGDSAGPILSTTLSGNMTQVVYGFVDPFPGSPPQ